MVQSVNFFGEEILGPGHHGIGNLVRKGMFYDNISFGRDRGCAPSSEGAACRHQYEEQKSKHSTACNFIFAFLNNSSNSLSKELTIVSQWSGKDKGVYGFLAGHTD